MDAVEIVQGHCQAWSGINVVPAFRDLVERWRAADSIQRERLINQTPGWAELSPDIEVHPHVGPGATPARGWDAVIELVSAWYTEWQDYTFETSAYRDLGEGRVLNRVHVRGHGRGGIPVEMMAFELRRVRDGLIISWEIFGSEQDALAACGHT